MDRETKMKKNLNWHLFISNFFSFLPTLKIPKNKYSLVIIGIYILVCFLMDYRSSASIFEGITMSFFPIMVFVAWSDFFIKNISKQTLKPKKKDVFHQDLFLIFYGFYAGCLIHIISEFSNLDVRGWSALAMLFLFAYGFLFSFLYSFIGMLVERGYLYRILFPVGIFLLMATLRMWPRYLNIDLINIKSPFELILATSLSIHFFYCISKLILHKYRGFYEKH
jgi:hypothetical protein